MEITPEIVWEKAQLIRQAAATIQANIDIVEQQIQFLSTSEDFDGRAAQDVLDDYQQLRSLMFAMPDVLNLYARNLDDAADKFSELDRRLSNMS